MQPACGNVTVIYCFCNCNPLLYLVLENSNRITCHVFLPVSSCSPSLLEAISVQQYVIIFGCLVYIIPAHLPGKLQQ